MARITVTGGTHPAHVRKIARTVIGDITEVDVLVYPGTDFETHVSSDHVLTVIELAPGEPLPETAPDTTE